MRRGGVVHKACMRFAVAFCMTVIFWSFVTPHGVDTWNMQGIVLVLELPRPWRFQVAFYRDTQQGFPAVYHITFTNQ